MGVGWTRADSSWCNERAQNPGRECSSHTGRRRLASRAGTRKPGGYRQAVLVPRRLLDGTRVRRLAAEVAPLTTQFPRRARRLRRARAD
ncbi:hypothetical protein GCM10010172_40950 [Paractinoplanes ferrugineus]|uniref:Uncharacterized protein n=1 Tax=Paractinoplanes ferrugineus TaxID=113564 RepID=A0A919MGZ8_9ACTN|nr:hypothetical protein Afe05nite_39750 [Actinoplanes ferrugineus]